MLITDTCNVASVYREPPIAQGMFPPQPVQSKALADLLFNHTGVVDVSGSSRGQYGFYTVQGWFTKSLEITLFSWERDQGADWKAFVEKLSENTSALFKACKRAVMASPEPTSKQDKDNRALLSAQADQKPQAFQLEVRRVGK